jgi:hypothetical protein
MNRSYSARQSIVSPVSIVCISDQGRWGCPDGPIGGVTDILLLGCEGATADVRQVLSRARLGVHLGEHLASDRFGRVGHGSSSNREGVDLTPDPPVSACSRYETSDEASGCEERPGAFESRD